MKFKFAIFSLSLTLYYASLNAQKCNQATSFTIQIPGQSDLPITLNADGSICSMTAANTCNTFAFCTDNGIFWQLEPKSNCAAPTCRSFSLTKLNGKLLLQCLNTLTSQEMNLVGFSTSRGFITGDPTKLQNPQSGVTLKPINDPCKLFQSPSPATSQPKPASPSPAPPSITSSAGTAGTICSSTTPCQKGLCWVRVRVRG